MHNRPLSVYRYSGATRRAPLPYPLAKSLQKISPKIQRWSPRGRPWPQGRPRGHILKSLASKPQVLENFPVFGSRTALFFEQLKFRWKTPETSRKICEHLFCFSHLEHRLSQLKFHQKRLLFFQFQFLFSLFRLQH